MDNRAIYILIILLLLGCKGSGDEIFLQEELPSVPTMGRLQFVGEKKCVVNAIADELKVTIDCNVNYSLSISQEWITEAPNQEMKDEFDFWKGKILRLKVAENRKDEERKAKVVIYNEVYGLSDTLYVTQKEGGTCLSDGGYQLLQRASMGNVNLVVMGDGFTSQHLTVNGHYMAIMKQTVDYFFSIEPFKFYRNYFNVYAVIAESEEAGVAENDSWRKTKNKFGTAFGSGTEIVCNSDLVFEYARKVKEIPVDKPLTVIVVLNSSKYAGTTYLYSNGNSIALCPMSDEPSPNNFEGLIHHEAGGHGFGFLCDEYVYYQQTIPESRKQNIKEWQEYGFQMNLDFTDDTSEVLWKDFVGMDKYKQVGVYEGGYEYQYGVWRSEENSCMNNNVPYFNVQSRWAIVNRIMKLAEKEFTVRDFMKADNPVLPDAATRSVAEKAFRPLGEPIWIN